MKRLRFTFFIPLGSELLTQSRGQSGTVTDIRLMMLNVYSLYFSLSIFTPLSSRLYTKAGYDRTDFKEIGLITLVI